MLLEAHRLNQQEQTKINVEKMQYIAINNEQLFYANSPAHVTQLYNIIVANNPHRWMQLWMNEKKKKEELLN